MTNEFFYKHPFSESEKKILQKFIGKEIVEISGGQIFPGDICYDFCTGEGAVIHLFDKDKSYNVLFRDRAYYDEISDDIPLIRISDSGFYFEKIYTKIPVSDFVIKSIDVFGYNYFFEMDKDSIKTRYKQRPTIPDKISLKIYTENCLIIKSNAGNKMLVYSQEEIHTQISFNEEFIDRVINQTRTLDNNRREKINTFHYTIE